MKRLKLTTTEKSDLELQHSVNRDKKESDRIKALLLRSEGWTVPMISQALRIHSTTVTRHINDYREGKLTNESGGSESLLNFVETKELISDLEKHTYKSTAEVIAHVRFKHGVSYSVPGINKWLHRNGFSYKKPKGYPYKFSKEEQAKFISNYQSLKKKLKRGKGHPL